MRMLKEDGCNLEMKMYSVLVIGCGKIAGIYDVFNSNTFYSHSSAYFSSKHTEKIIFCDINLKNAKKLASIYNSKFYGSDYIELIKNYNPNIISICTPTETHFEIASSIMKSRILPDVLFIEKPVCENSKELDTLINLSSNYKVKTIVNQSRRFDTKHIEIKKLFNSGFFGDLVKIDCYYYGGWYHNGIHLVDTLNYIFDDNLKIEKVYNKKKIKDGKDFDVDLKLKFKKNDIEVIFNSINEKNYQLFEFDIKFTKSRLRIEDFGNRFIYESKYVNNMNENVLMLDELNFSKNIDESPICRAVSIIYNYLNLNDDSLLTDYSLEAVRDSMQCIWNLK